MSDLIYVRQILAWRKNWVSEAQYLGLACVWCVSARNVVMTKPEGSETERQQAEKTSSTCEGCVSAAAAAAADGGAGRLTRQTTAWCGFLSWSCCWWRLAEAANMSVFDPQLLTSSTHNNAAAPINVHAALSLSLGTASRDTSLTATSV